MRGHILEDFEDNPPGAAAEGETVEKRNDPRDNRGDNRGDNQGDNRGDDRGDDGQHAGTKGSKRGAPIEIEKAFWNVGPPPSQSIRPLFPTWFNLFS